MISALRYLFWLMAVTSFYMMYISLFNNGFFDLLSQQLATRTVPGESPVALLSEYTGLKALDGVLENTIIFFWPISQGHHAGLSLLGLGFAGGMVGTWMIVVVHICRTFSFIRGMAIALVVGIAQQAVGPGVVIPCFFAVASKARPVCESPHPTGAGPTPTDGLVASMIMSYILPLATMSLTAPSMIAPDVKQQLIAAWQGWPVYFVVLLIVHHYTMGSTHPRGASARRQLRSVYRFGFLCSYICHMVWLSAFVASKIQSFAQSRDLYYLRPYGVTFPLFNQPAEGLGALEAGLFTFLQWDYGIAAMATVVWSTDRHIQECHRAGLEISKSQLIRRLLGWMLIDGPSATAVRLAWESEDISYLQDRSVGTRLT